MLGCLSIVAKAQISNTIYHSLLDEAGFNAKNIDLMRPVGTTPGEAGVSESGAGAYAVPIAIPPGTNGVQPNLSVSYNSQSGNGLLGYGWSLSASSIITRGTKTKFVDDEAKGVVLTNSDAFYLDGKRLYLKSGSYGISGSTYNFEVEDYGQVEMKNVTAMGAQEFVYTTKEGMKMYYNPVSSVSKNGQMFYYSWHLKKVEDLHGNYCEYFYNLYQGEVYLSNIAYTKNTAQGLNHYNNVQFHYSRRTDRSQNYDAGLSFTQSLLLDRIEITGEYGTAFKNYIFRYGYNGRFSLLREIAEQGTDGSELNSSVFRYGVNAENLTSTTILPAPNQDKDIYYGDFDGDGIIDMLCHYCDIDPQTGNRTYTGFAIWKRSTTSSTWYQSGPVIPTPGNYEFNKQPFTVNSFIANDFNGDGRSDILLIKTAINQNGKKVVDFFKIYYPNETATAFTEETIYPPVISSANYDNGVYNISGNNQGFNFITIGDFDGDGKSDFITVLSNSQGFKNFYIRPATASPIQQINNIYAVNSFFDGMNIADQNGKLYAIEMNGDGKTELMVVENSLTKVYEVLKNTGNAAQPWKFNLLMTDGYPSKWHDILQFGDFNGDGKTDIITNVKSTGYKEIAINNGDDKWIGAPLQLDHSWTNSSRLGVGDFNGDGRADYIHEYTNWTGGYIPTAINTTMDLYISTGIGVNKSSFDVSTTNSLVPIIIADFNGDGKDDILDFISSNSFLKYYSLGFGFNNQLLHKVKNGHGVVNEFIYSRLNSGQTFYTKDKSSAYPLNVLNAPVWCVNQFLKPDGVGGVHAIYHTYKNLLLHRGGRGVLGFETHTVIDPLFNVRTETLIAVQATYNQPYLSSHKTYRHNINELLTESKPAYQFAGLANGRFRQRLISNTNTDWKMNVANVTNYTYDNYGNPAQVTESAINPQWISLYPPPNPFYRTITTVSAYVTSGGLVPTVPASVTVQKQRYINGSGSSTKTTTFSYNNKGQVSEQTEFSGMPKAVTTSYYYNGFGNVTSQSVNAQGMLTRVENYSYDNAQRFLVSKTVPCPTCPGAPTLTESYTYSPLWGSITSKKDAQCQQFYSSYDAFGRLITATDNHGTVATTAYTWISGINSQLFRKTVTIPNRPYDRRAYDILGRETAIYTQNKDGQNISAFTAYNFKGQKVSETNAHYSNETPLYTYFSYDAYGRLSQVQNFQGTTTTSYQYPAGAYGLKITTIFPDGRSKEQLTDATGVIKSVWDDGGMLVYQYNANNDVTLTQKDGITVLTNGYDAYGRLNQTTDPNTGTVNYEYNAYGDLFRQTDNTGNLIEKQYDGLGRTTATISPEGTTQYEYGLHNVFIPNQIIIPGSPFPAGTYCPTQVLKKIIGYNGIEQTFAYNDRAVPIIKHETIDGQTYSTFYNYATNGDLQQTIYPSGVTVQNVYNTLGFLTDKKDQGNTTLYQLLQTNGMGQPTKYRLGNGLTSSIAYNNGFPQLYSTPGVQNLVLSFDHASGNLTARKDNIKNREETFAFDQLNRLTQAHVVGQAAVVYQYDPNVPSASQTLGNIQAKYDVGGYSYQGSKINAVTQVHNMLSGNLPPQNISATEQKINYTALQRPATINEGLYEYEIIYSPQNERIKTIKKFRGSIEETKYYFEGCELIVNARGSKWVTYVNGAGGLAAMIVSQNGTHSNYYTYTDHLGSIVTLTNASASIVAEQNFDAWGRRRDPNTWLPLPPQVAHVLDWLARGYTGHEHLPEFALINMNARLYDPVLGRMLSPDNYIMGESNTQGYNRYSYALNNPLKYTDPSGEVVLEFIFGMLSRGSFRERVAEGGQRAWNSIKLLGGLFIFDGSYGGKGDVGRDIWQIFSRHTWEGGQTGIGFGFAILSNLFGATRSVEYYHGATMSISKRGTGSVSLGSFIKLGGDDPEITIGIGPGSYTTMHEYGHYLQSKRMGPMYLWKVGLPSAMDATWTEHDANYSAARYFQNLDRNFFWDENYYGGQNNNLYSRFRTAGFDNNSLVRSKWWEYMLHFFVPVAGLMSYDP